MLLACIFLSWMSLAVETAIVLCQSISVYVADLQNVNITLRILFRPIADSLPDIFTNLGIDYDEKVLPSIVNEVLKAVVVSIFLWYILINVPYFLFLNFFIFYLQRLPCEMYLGMMARLGLIVDCGTIVAVYWIAWCLLLLYELLSAWH